MLAAVLPFASPNFTSVPHRPQEPGLLVIALESRDPATFKAVYAFVRKKLLAVTVSGISLVGGDVLSFCVCNVGWSTRHVYIPF